MKLLKCALKKANSLAPHQKKKKKTKPNLRSLSLASPPVPCIPWFRKAVWLQMGWKRIFCFRGIRGGIPGYFFLVMFPPRIFVQRSIESPWGGQSLEKHNVKVRKRGLFEQVRDETRVRNGDVKGRVKRASNSRRGRAATLQGLFVSHMRCESPYAHLCWRGLYPFRRPYIPFFYFYEERRFSFMRSEIFSMV